MKSDQWQRTEALVSERRGAPPPDPRDFAPFQLDDNEWRDIRGDFGLPDVVRKDFGLLIANYASGLLDCVGEMTDKQTEEFVKRVLNASGELCRSSETSYYSMAAREVLGTAWRALTAAQSELRQASAKLAYQRSMTRARLTPTMVYRKLLDDLAKIMRKHGFELTSSRKRSKTPMFGPDFVDLILRIAKKKIEEDADLSTKNKPQSREIFGTKFLITKIPKKVVEDHITERNKRRAAVSERRTVG